MTKFTKNTSIFEFVSSFSACMHSVSLTKSYRYTQIQNKININDFAANGSKLSSSGNRLAEQAHRSHREYYISVPFSCTKNRLSENTHTITETEKAFASNNGKNQKQKQKAKMAQKATKKCKTAVQWDRLCVCV